MIKILIQDVCIYIYTYSNVKNEIFQYNLYTLIVNQSLHPRLLKEELINIYKYWNKNTNIIKH